LTQEFMLHLLQKSFFERADRMRGRFRSFLLGALARFLADAADKREALKRGGAQVHFDWASAEAGNGHEVSCPPEIAQVFDREWALTMLECALARVREEYSRQRPQHVFAVLQRFLPGSARPPSYEEAAQQLGVSLGALRSEVHRLRGRLRMLLREEVAQTVSAPHEIEPEMGHLRRVLMEDSSGLPPDPKYEVLEF
jgi:RNA polymerase sigma-70 factor (ECF subfamily)